MCVCVSLSLSLCGVCVCACVKMSCRTISTQPLDKSSMNLEGTSVCNVLAISPNNFFSEKEASKFRKAIPPKNSGSWPELSFLWRFALEKQRSAEQWIRMLSGRAWAIVHNIVSEASPTSPLHSSYILKNLFPLTPPLLKGEQTNIHRRDEKMLEHTRRNQDVHKTLTTKLVMTAYCKQDRHYPP